MSALFYVQLPVIHKTSASTKMHDFNPLCWCYFLNNYDLLKEKTDILD